MKRLMYLTLALASTGVFAADADQLNLRCAPCHGLYGQGAPGKNSPRLAGLPAWYLAKATKDYVKDARKNSLMVEVAGLKDMPKKEIEKLAGWLSKQNIGKDRAYDIKMTAGDAQAGRKKFQADCKNCHAANGYGKKKKDAPPLAGQHSGYLLASMKAFFRKDRYHDNDPIDDTFDDISDAQARDILAWMSSLDDKKQQADFHFRPRSLPLTVPGNAGYLVKSVQQTIIGAIAKRGVSIRQVIAAMLAKAADLDVPKMPELPEAEDKLPQAVDLKFCAPRHISRLISAAPEMANYDPCRVTVVKRPDNSIQLMTINLDTLIDGEQLPPDVQRIAIQINQDMLAIISAGSKASLQVESSR